MKQQGNPVVMALSVLVFVTVAESQQSKRVDTYTLAQDLMTNRSKPGLLEKAKNHKSPTPPTPK